MSDSPEIERESGSDESRSTRSRSLDPPEAGPATVSIPRKFRDAKEGRDSMTVYISPETTTELRELRHHVDMEYPEDNVRKLDLYAAVIQAGLESFDKPTEILDQWGYGKEIER